MTRKRNLEGNRENVGKRKDTKGKDLQNLGNDGKFSGTGDWAASPTDREFGTGRQWKAFWARKSEREETLHGFCHIPNEWEKKTRRESQAKKGYPPPEVSRREIARRDGHKKGVKKPRLLGNGERSLIPGSDET